MDLIWNLPEKDEQSELERKAGSCPDSPEGLNEEQMQEVLLYKLQWMLSCFYRGKYKLTQAAAVTMNKWLKEASFRGYSGYIWDYLNLELYKLSIRFYGMYDQWEKAEEDLKECDLFLERIRAFLYNPVSESKDLADDDGLCLASACVETEFLRYFQMKHTGEGIEACRKLGEASRFVGYVSAKYDVMSWEQWSILGLLNMFGGIKQIVTDQRELAEKSLEQAFDLFQKAQKQEEGDVEEHLFIALSLLAEAEWRFNFPRGSEDEQVAFINDYKERLSKAKWVCTAFDRWYETGGFCEALITASYALMMNFGITAGSSVPGADLPGMLENCTFFADKLLDVLSVMKNSSLGRRRAWDLMLDLLYETFYVLRLSMKVMKATLHYNLKAYPEAKTELENCLKELNSRELVSDLKQQLRLQLSCHYLNAMIEADTGNGNKAFFISRQALDMVKTTEISLQGAETTIGLLCMIAGDGSLASKEKNAAGSYAEMGLAALEEADAAVFGQQVRVLKKELKRILRKSRGWLF